VNLLKKKRVYFWLRLLFGLFLILVIVMKVDMEKALSVFRSIGIIHVILATLLATCDCLLTAYRWQMLLKSKNIDVPFGKIIRINFVGRFVGRFFPSSIAPDAIKAYSLAKYIDNASEAMSSIFIERYIGLFSLLTLAFFGVIASFKTYPNYNILWILLAMLSIFFTFWFLLFNKSVATKIANRLHFLRILRRKSWGQKVANFYHSLLLYKTNDVLLFKVLMLSYVIQTVRILMIYVGSLALNLGISVVYFFMFIPVIIIITMIPTTIASIGVAEGAYVYFFSRVGASIHGAFALSILIRILYTFLTLPGGIFYIKEGISPQKK